MLTHEHANSLVWMASNEQGIVAKLHSKNFKILGMALHVNDERIDFAFFRPMCKKEAAFMNIDVGGGTRAAVFKSYDPRASRTST